MGRRIRTNLPTTPALLKPLKPTLYQGKLESSCRNTAAVLQPKCESSETSEYRGHCRGRKPGLKIWTSAVVTRVTEAPRLYAVDSEGTSDRRTNQ